MMKYEQTQYGWFVIIVFLLVIGFLFLAYLNQWGNNPIPRTPFLIMIAVFITPLALFYKMTIRVEERTVRIIYGIGLIRKEFSPERILNMEIYKIPWYYGMGIRITHEGWLYSLNSFKSVKITFPKDGKNKTILIGSPEPEKLIAVLEVHFPDYEPVIS